MSADGLQGSTPGGSGFVPAEAQETVSGRARQSVVEVRADGKRLGTGFLVAPRHILTCWHVVEGVSDARPGSVVFESASGTENVDFAREWNAAHSAYAGDETTADGPEAGRWDYALVELERPVTDRDPYDLTDVVADESAQVMLWVAGYPESHAQMQTSHGLGWTRSASGTRVRHGVDTANGSSGGPIVTANNRLVGVHQAWVRLEGKNQGVPIGDIVADIERSAPVAVRVELGLEGASEGAVGEEEGDGTSTARWRWIVAGGAVVLVLAVLGVGGSTVARSWLTYDEEYSMDIQRDWTVADVLAAAGRDLDTKFILAEGCDGVGTLTVDPGALTVRAATADAVAEKFVERLLVRASTPVTSVVVRAHEGYLQLEDCR